jgi:hypothetical protein
MIETWKAAALAALVAVSIATPALAQSAWFASGPYGSSRGFEAFAMVPRISRGCSSEAVTGGRKPRLQLAN